MISSLKVLDLSTVLAGPSVGTFFSELGADVLKIEHPIFFDVTRNWKQSIEKGNNVSSYFSSVNYRKTYRSLDLSQKIDRVELDKLLQTADILLTNFKKADYIKFNLTFNELHELYPRLIHGRISGYGMDSNRVAYDLILQAETGFMSMNGTQESGPVKMPVAMIDVIAAHQLKEGILIALYNRLLSGKGEEVSVSLYDAAVTSLTNQASSYLMTGFVPERLGTLHPSIAPYGELFYTIDNCILTFAIGSDKQFEKLMFFIGKEIVILDQRFSSNSSRVIYRTELAEIISKEISLKTSVEVLNWSLENDIPCGKIKDLAQVFQDIKVLKKIREEEIDGENTKRLSSIAFQFTNDNKITG